MSKPTIYIAGASADLPRARAAMELARSLGYVVEYDWPQGIDEAGGRANEGLERDEAREASALCIQAAIRADVMWLLLDPELRSPGAHVELGARLVSGGYRARALYTTGPRPSSSIHYSWGQYVGEHDALMRETLSALLGTTEEASDA